MDRTAHGGDLYGRRAALDFSSNISPLGLPETVGHALVASMEAWDNYPDPFCRDLTAALAQLRRFQKIGFILEMALQI